jgi:hypothetical protein
MQLQKASTSRRQFLALLAASSGALVASHLASDDTDAAPFNRTIYFLDPEWGAGNSTCPCSACSACHGHAANKFWTSADLADSNRAHSYCKCLVDSKEVSTAAYISLFGPPAGPRHRDAFDRRQDELWSLPDFVLSWFRQGQQSRTLGISDGWR